MKRVASLCLLLLFLLAGGIALAQSRDDQRSPSVLEKGYRDYTKALPLDQSSAEAEAERLVALSADKIITILNNEPGLLLECKKVLVRTAYQQGRLLATQDLDDDVLFRLVREDENVRVL